MVEWYTSGVKGAMMNKAQKRLLINLVSTIVIIGLFIFGFANFKDYINRSEAVRAFGQLGQKILEYRSQYGQLPSESAIETLKEQVEGYVRAGTIRYRAEWITIGSPPDTIVAYAEKHYNSFIASGFVFLQLDGQVRYMPTKEFMALLAKQQTMAEAQEMQKSRKSNSGF